MDFRIGVNMGDVIVEGTNLYGEGVNIAARLESYCPTGGIAISKNIYELINQKVDFKFDDKGIKILRTSVHTFVLGSSDQKESQIFGSTRFAKTHSSLPTIAILPKKLEQRRGAGILRRWSKRILLLLYQNINGCE